VFAPVRDRVFAPVFVSVAETPAMIPDKVPDAVVTSTVNPVLDVMAILLLTVTADANARVVPVDVVNVLVPRAAASFIAMVPALSVVPPAYVLAPERVNVPAPAFVIDPFAMTPVQKNPAPELEAIVKVLPAAASPMLEAEIVAVLEEPL
jgi:hypothetical protein